MAIEKLGGNVFIDKDAKVAYYSEFNEEARYLIEMNAKGFTVKNASEMPKPKRKSKNPVPKKADFEKTLTTVEKRIYNAKLAESNRYMSAYHAVMEHRKNKENSAAKAAKEEQTESAE